MTGLQIKWDPDPLYFIFKKDVPGVAKMHIHKLDLKDWVKLDSSYYDQMRLRKQLMEEYPEMTFATRDESSTNTAKEEFLELLVDNLVTYHSDKFRIMFDANNQKIGIENLILSEKYLFRSELDPLVIASHLVQDDWIILEWDEKYSEYVITAGILCFPLGWTLPGKFLQPLRRIHAPVRQYDHLKENVESVFESLEPSISVWRANWVLTNGATSSLDLNSSVLHKKEVTSEFDSDRTGKEIFFRAEYQTLRRLPKSNAVLFSIRTYQRPLEEFLHFPKEDSEALVFAIRNLSKDSVAYKRVDLWGTAALRYLEEVVLKQSKL